MRKFEKNVLVSVNLKMADLFSSMAENVATDRAKSQVTKQSGGDNSDLSEASTSKSKRDDKANKEKGKKISKGLSAQESIEKLSGIMTAGFANLQALFEGSFEP